MFTFILHLRKTFAPLRYCTFDKQHVYLVPNQRTIYIFT
jgi:hypothetical protein